MNTKVKRIAKTLSKDVESDFLRALEEAYQAGFDQACGDLEKETELCICGDSIMVSFDHDIIINIPWKKIISDTSGYIAENTFTVKDRDQMMKNLKTTSAALYDVFVKHPPSE